MTLTSTLEGYILILTCENDIATDELTLTVTCHSNGSWIPDPAQFTCSPISTTVQSVTEILINSSPHSTMFVEEVLYAPITNED